MLGELDHVGLAYAVIHTALEDAFLRKGKVKREATQWLTEDSYGLSHWCGILEMDHVKFTKYIKEILNDTDKINEIKVLLKQYRYSTKQIELSLL